MTDHYKCGLRTVQSSINDYKLPLWLISNSVHLEICRDSRFSDKYINNSYENFFGYRGKSEGECEKLDHSVCTLLLLTLPSYFLAVFLVDCF